MKILICTFSFPAPKINHFGGNFVAGEAIAYAENGANVIVLTPHLKGVDKEEQIHENVNVIRFQYLWPEFAQTLLRPNQPIYSQKSLLSLFQVPFLCFFFAINIYRHAGWADIIHSQWTLSALLALPSKWLRRVKIVLTARGSDIRLLPLWLNRFIHNKVDGAIDCFGPQSWNEEYKKKFQANFIILPLIVYNNSSAKMPADLKDTLNKKPGTFVILYVGRFDYAKIKDHDLPLLDLIHAINNIRSLKNDFHVVYLGDGEATAEMSELIAKYQLAEYISLLGPKSNVFDYIRICDLGVGGVAFNGVSEEFTVEGVPQVLVRGGANANSPWIDRENAVFIEGGNVPDIVEKLKWSLDNRGALKRIGEKAKRDMEKLLTDSKHGGMLYLQQFQKLLDKG
jgi:glycosyltransferase involved in cell wall biosynthesis